MRKITIVEVENSFLTLFTPAVVVAAAYILFNVVAWPILILERYLENIIPDIILSIISPILSIIGLIIVISIVAFIFILRLRIRYVDYKRWDNLNSFLITSYLLCGAIITAKLFFDVFDAMGWESSEVPPFTVDWGIPISVLLFILYKVVITPVFDSIVYSRTVIPLLEDRGISPLLAVVLASFGSASMSIPSILLGLPLNYYHIRLFFLPLLIGFFFGTTYILTRNLLFTILLAGCLELYFYLPAFLYNFLPSIAFLVIIVGFCYWVIALRNKFGISKELTKKTAPLMSRGIIGFLRFFEFRC